MTLELMDYLSHAFTSRFVTQNNSNKLLQVLSSVFNASSSANVKQKVSDIVAWWSNVDPIFASFYERLSQEGYRVDGKSKYAGGHQIQQGSASFDFQSGWGSGATNTKPQKPAGIVRIEGQLEVLGERVSHAEKDIRSGSNAGALRELLETLRESQGKLNELEKKLSDYPDVLSTVKGLNKRISKLQTSSSASNSEKIGFDGFDFGGSSSKPNNESSKFELDWGSQNTKPKGSKEQVKFSMGGGTNFNTAFSNTGDDFFSDIGANKKNGENQSPVDFNFGINQPTKSMPKDTGSDFWGGSAPKQQERLTNNIWDTQESTFSFQTASQIKTTNNDFELKDGGKADDFWGKPLDTPKQVLKKASIWDNKDDDSSDDDNTGYKPPLDDPFKEMENEQAAGGFDYFSGKFGEAGINGKVEHSQTVPMRPTQNDDLFTKFDMDIKHPKFSEPTPSPMGKDDTTDLLGFGDTLSQPISTKSEPNYGVFQGKPSAADFDLMDLGTTSTQPTTQNQIPANTSNPYDILNVAQQQVNTQHMAMMYGMPTSQSNPFGRSPGQSPQVMMGNYGMPGMMPINQQYAMGQQMAIGSIPGSPMMMQGSHMMQNQGVYMMNPAMGMGGVPTMGYSGHHTPTQIQGGTLGATLGTSNTITFSQPQTPLNNHTSTNKIDTSKTAQNDPFGDLEVDLI